MKWILGGIAILLFLAFVVSRRYLRRGEKERKSGNVISGAGVKAKDQSTEDALFEQAALKAVERFDTRLISDHVYCAGHYSFVSDCEVNIGDEDGNLMFDPAKVIRLVREKFVFPFDMTFPWRDDTALVILLNAKHSFLFGFDNQRFDPSDPDRWVRWAMEERDESLILAQPSKEVIERGIYLAHDVVRLAGVVPPTYYDELERYGSPGYRVTLHYPYDEFKERGFYLADSQPLPWTYADSNDVEGAWFRIPRYIRYEYVQTWCLEVLKEISVLQARLDLRARLEQAGAQFVGEQGKRYRDYCEKFWEDFIAKHVIVGGEYDDQHLLKGGHPAIPPALKTRGWRYWHIYPRVRDPRITKEIWAENEAKWNEVNQQAKLDAEAGREGALPMDEPGGPELAFYYWKVNFLNAAPEFRCGVKWPLKGERIEREKASYAEVISEPDRPVKEPDRPVEERPEERDSEWKDSDISSGTYNSGSGDGMHH